MTKLEQITNEAMAEEAFASLLDAVGPTDPDKKRAWRLLETATQGATPEQHTALETLFSLLAGAAKRGNEGRG